MDEDRRERERREFFFQFSRSIGYQPERGTEEREREREDDDDANNKKYPPSWMVEEKGRRRD